MGMTAYYTEADKELIDRLKKLSEDDLFDEIEELTEDSKSYDMDKMWDGLHFILTGVSACTPVENNLLSEAIAGTSTFSGDPDSDYIAYIYPERLIQVLERLNQFDINDALADFSPRELARNHIYPTIWYEENKEILKEELIREFHALKSFYEKMTELQKGVIVSIY